MKTLVSLTIFIYAVVIGATLLGGLLLERYGNLRKVTEVTRIENERVRVTAPRSGDADQGGASSSTPSSEALSSADAGVVEENEGQLQSVVGADDDGEDEDEEIEEEEEEEYEDD